jgi:hypothetical protein
MNKKQQIITLTNRRFSPKEINKLTSISNAYIERVIRKYNQDMTLWIKTILFFRKYTWQILTILGFLSTIFSLTYILFPTFSHNTLELVGLEEKEKSNPTIKIEEVVGCLMLSNYNFSGNCRTFYFDINNWDSNIDARQLYIRVNPPKDYNILGISRGEIIKNDYRACLKNYLPTDQATNEKVVVNNEEHIIYEGLTQAQEVEIYSRVFEKGEWFSFYVHFLSNSTKLRNSPCVDFQWNIDDDGGKTIYGAYGGQCPATAYIIPTQKRILCQEW